EPEGHMGVPSRADVLDRVPRVLHRALLSEIQVEPVLDDRVDQTLLRAEEVIERRHLHADGIAHGPQREVLAGAGGDVLGGGSVQPLPSTASLVRSHPATLPCISQLQRYIPTIWRYRDDGPDPQGQERPDRRRREEPRRP